MKNKWSTNLIGFGGMNDRYVASGYQTPSSTRERILRAKGIPGVEGVELHYPGMFGDLTPIDMKALLEEAGLECSIVSPMMSSEPSWSLGTLTSSDPVIRAEAAQRIMEAMDVAVLVGAYRVNLWLGQDGFDYPFQTDFRAMWRNLVKGVSECASHDPRVSICLEPKLKEPRTHSVLGTVPTVLLLVNDIGMDNVGCLLDTGHAIMAHENLAEDVVRLQERGKLFHIHFNDNYGDWDWDMIVGSVHSLEFLEMMFWIRQVGYGGWFSLDQFPQRDDPASALALSIRTIKRMERVVEMADTTTLLSAMAHGDHIAVRQVFEGSSP